MAGAASIAAELSKPGGSAASVGDAVGAWSRARTVPSAAAPTAARGRGADFDARALEAAWPEAETDPRFFLSASDTTSDSLPGSGASSGGATSAAKARAAPCARIDAAIEAEKRPPRPDFEAGDLPSTFTIAIL